MVISSSMPADPGGNSPRDVTTSEVAFEVADCSRATTIPGRRSKTASAQTRVCTDPFQLPVPQTESDGGKRLLPGACSQFLPCPCTKYAIIPLTFFYKTDQVLENGHKHSTKEHNHKSKTSITCHTYADHNPEKNPKNKKPRTTLFNSSQLLL